MLRQVFSSAILVAAVVAPAQVVAQSSPSPMPMGSMSMPMGDAPAAKMPVCKAGDSVVWVNTKSKAFYTSDAAMYGKTKHGKYACQSSALAAGDHPAGKAATGSMRSTGTMSSPAPGPVKTGGTTETNAQPNAVNSSSPSP